MRYFFWSVLLLLLITRIFIYFSSRQKYSDGQKIRISDELSSQPIRYSNSQQIKLAGFNFYLPLFPEVTYGDFLVVEGLVAGDKLKNVRLIKVQEGSNFLFSFRKKLLNFYQKSLPQPHSALIAGVALGAKSDIPRDFWDDLKATGTAHVVVASGMNVTLVAGFLINFFILFFPRRSAIPLALAGIWAYSLMAGFDAPIIRAAVMGSLSLTAQKLGRLYDAWRALFLSAILMLLIRPDWTTDLGFILSFVATTSLMLFESKISRLIHFIPHFFREGFSTSLAAQIGVAPILYVTFGQFNILSPVVNALVLWTIPYITQIAIMGGLVGLLVEPLGRLILLLTFPMTSWFTFVVDLFG